MPRASQYVAVTILVAVTAVLVWLMVDFIVIHTLSPSCEERPDVSGCYDL